MKQSDSSPVAGDGVTAEAVDAAIAKFYEGYPCEIAKSYVHFKPMRAAILATGLPAELAKLRAQLLTTRGQLERADDELQRAMDALAERDAQLAEVRKDVERYQWWRDNFDAIEDDPEGIAGLAYSCQIPPDAIDKASDAELFDMVADFEIATQKDK